MDHAGAEEILREAVKRDPNASFDFNQVCDKCEIPFSQSDLLLKISTPYENWKNTEGYVWNIDQDFKETFAHHACIDDLQRAAANGCHFCTTLCDGLDLSTLRNVRPKPSPPKRDKPDRGCNLCTLICGGTDLSTSRNVSTGAGPTRHGKSDQSESKDPDILYLRITMPIRKGRDYFVSQKQTHIKLGQYDANTGELKMTQKTLLIGRAEAFKRRTHQRMGPLKSLYTGSDATFELAKEWLKTCVKGHKECSLAYSSALAFPSRLLQVNTSSGGISIRLCDSEHIRKENETERLPYLTLSHRWPKEPITCLTKDNEELFKTEIPVNSIPKNFEDAALITRRLGFEYLWIDSLCIIQDSPLDWEHESALMGDIYRGSVLTIAALSSGGESTQGILTIRNPLKYIPFGVRRERDPNTKDTTITTTERLTLIYFAIGPNAIMDERHPGGELMTRGWVVQERVLSPRTLYFEPRGIIWECHECYANPEFPEMSSNGSMEVSYSPKQAFSLLRLDSLPDMNKPNGQFLSFHIAWSQLIESYAQCNLTMDSDRLVAVNSMIQKIQASTGMHAVAGHFMEILPLELLWFSTQNAEDAAPPPRPYRAPSWSWASIDVPVKSNYVDLVRKLEFSFDWKLRVVSYEANAKPNGLLLSAHVVVEAILHKIKWPSHGERTRKLHRPFPNQTTHRKREHCDHWVADCADAYDGDIWALQIAHGTGAFFMTRDDECSVYENGMCDVGILVKKVDGEDGMFRRVGYFEQHYWELDKHPVFIPGIEVDTQQITLV